MVRPAQGASKLRMTLPQEGGDPKPKLNHEEDQETDLEEESTENEAESDDESRDTDEELDMQAAMHSKKTSRLLGADEHAKQQPSILSLAPSVRRTANTSTLRAKAARMALEKRREREERAHVRDVIGDWGPPGVLPGQTVTPEAPTMLAWTEQGGAKGYERRLRKVAQRGVVKLFNAIRAAQETSVDDVDKARALKRKGTKTNALGNTETAVNELSRNNFLDLLRSNPKGTSA